MLQLISLLLENKPGALMRVTGVLTARGYNIESLTVARTPDPALSRMSIVVEIEPSQRAQLIKQMNKLINVLQASDLTEAPVEKEKRGRRCRMVNRYYERDGDLALLKDKTIAIIGYGSQGHAHALNLRDSGLSVVVGLHAESTSRAKAESAGLRVLPTAEAAAAASVVMILTHDHLQGDIYREDIAPHMSAGKTLMFAHGFNIHYGRIQAPEDVDVSMIAPKAPGHRVRELFTEGVGTPALVAVDQNPSGHALEQALAYALALGCLKAGVIETTFKEETESDLFGEQAVLCGGVTELIRAGFETLTGAGYAPEIAYFECLHELKLIVDLIYEGGLGYMRYSVSDIAEYGDYTRGPRVVNQQTRAEMKKILSEVQSGEFARAWISENKSGRKNFLAMREEAANQPLEQVGAELRGMMTFLKKKGTGAASS